MSGSTGSSETFVPHEPPLPPTHFAFVTIMRSAQIILVQNGKGASADYLGLELNFIRHAIDQYERSTMIAQCLQLASLDEVELRTAERYFSRRIFELRHG
jgi:hypothetical protein